MSALLIVDDHWPEMAAVIDTCFPGLPRVYEDQSDRVLPLLSRRKDIAVVLLDLKFDDQQMQGVDLLDRIKADHPGLPVYVLTARNEARLAARLIKEGKAEDYFVKEGDWLGEGVRQISSKIEDYAQRQRASSHQLRFIDSRRFAIGDVELQLPPLQFALYFTAAKALHEQWTGVGPTGISAEACGWIAYDEFYDPTTRSAQTLMAAYEGAYVGAIQRSDKLRDLIEACAPRPGYQRWDRRAPFRKKVSDKISPALTNVNKSLVKALQLAALFDLFQIKSANRRRGSRGVSTFGLSVTPQQIVLCVD